MDAFAYKSKTKGTLNSWCKACHQEYSRGHYDRDPKYYADKRDRAQEQLKLFIRQHKEVPCMDCGIQYPYYCMDFDHRADVEKLHNLSVMWRMGSKTAILAELEKCDVVCANCHRIRTHQRLRPYGGTADTLVLETRALTASRFESG